MKKNLFVLLSLCLAHITNGQEPWSLQQCIEYALENNIQVKQQELNVRLNENSYTRAKFSAYPNLNASANHNYSFGRAIDYGTNTVSNDIEATSFSINTSVTLFNGFQIRNTKKQEHFNLLASFSDVERLKNNIALNISAAYLQILFNHEILDANKEQMALTSLQVERTRQMVNAGSLPEGNLLDIEAQLASDELQLVNTQNQLDISYLTLTQLLELKTTDNFIIEKPDLSSFNGLLPPKSPMGIFEQAETILPQIKGANLRVQSAEKGVEVARSGHFPRLTLGGSYSSGARRLLELSYSDDPFMDQIKNNASRSIGLSLSVPIFNGWQVKHLFLTQELIWKTLG